MRLKIRKVRSGAKRWMLDLRPLKQGRKFFDTEDDAKAELDRRLAALENAKSVAVSLPIEKAMEFALADQRLAQHGATISQAVEFYLVRNRKRELVSLAEAVRRMLAEKEAAKRRERYVAQLRYDLNSFMGAVDPETTCSLISTQQVSAWLHGNDWEPKTVSGKLISLSTVFSFARNRGWVDSNPCDAIERISIDRKTPGILTPEAAAQLMQASRSHPTEARLVPYLALALFAGVRPQEVKQLRWSDIQEGILRIESSVSKVRSRRLVHLSENCKAWLALGGELPPVNWQDGLQVIRRAAGFQYSDRSKRKGRHSERRDGLPWPHNCLRHSFCSYSLVTHGLAETARQAGNSEAMIHEHYKALVTKAQAERFWAVMPQ